MSLRFSSIDITFTCAPFRYSVDNEPIAMASGGTIEVGGNYYAEPKIKVYGDGTGYLTTNGDTFTLYVAKYIVLDSERLIAYNENNDVAVSATVGSFPMLQVGTNSISWSGGITSLEVTKNERWL
jgi:phage-related protein